MSAVAEKLEWDSQAWRALRDRRLAEWLRGDADAVECFIQLSTISETWDDLIDRDKPVADAQIHEVFSCALIRLQTNRFFLANHAAIMSAVITGVNAWMDANELETRATEKERALAFYIRNYCYEMLSVMVFAVGGWDWLRKVSLEMRMFFQHESYGQWEKRL